MEFIFTAVGSIGLVAIICGMIVRREKHQDMLFILGGTLLLAYSFIRRDPVFVVLQIVFIAVALFELIHLIQTERKSLWRRWWHKK